MMELPVRAFGEGEALLLVHGAISEASFFYGLIDRLKDRYKLLAYDRRGYGEAVTPQDGDYRVISQAEDAAEILKAHATGPAWVLGHSAGSVIVLELALTHPDLVRGIILMEPSLSFDETSRQHLDGWNRQLNAYVKAGRIKKALPAFLAAFGPDESVPEGSFEGTSLQEMKRTYRNLTTFMKGELNEVEGHEISQEALRSLQAPVGILISELGQDRLFGSAAALGAEYMGWPIYKVPGNHNALKLHPAEAASVIDFVIGEMRNAKSQRRQV